MAFVLIYKQIAGLIARRIVFTNSPAITWPSASASD